VVSALSTISLSTVDTLPGLLKMLRCRLGFLTVCV